MKYSVAAPPHISAIATLEKENFPTPWTYSQYRDHCESGGDMIVALEKNVLCGYGALRRCGPEWELYKLAVVKKNETRELDVDFSGLL
ncbi:hypothetical protein [Chitinivibrio alkaliphilus]|uniref:Ribosomal-protein-alanine acetyltransferase n=1 Tax=Chitinivibrio alkaliphilus ACht1 TaxID=1313304 RepID=U7DCL0_9BACT|nr:hypothetical protein [Chitinivibrio alkaliphilus]ERP32180.1 hypothetical protein CALK_0910 [Chitinivibrio alkaliphilus ACht1]